MTALVQFVLVAAVLLCGTAIVRDELTFRANRRRTRERLADIDHYTTKDPR